MDPASWSWPFRPVVSSALFLALAAVCLVGGSAAVGRARRRRRLAGLVGSRVRARLPLRRPWPGRGWSPQDAVAVLGGAGLGFALVGGPVGCLLGPVAVYGLRVLRRRGGGGAGAGRQYMNKRGEIGDSLSMAEAAAQLPVVAELLAACLAAGSGPREAAGAVGGSMGGPLGERLVRASAELRLGGEPAAVWGRLEELPEAAELARCLERAGTTGVPAVEPMGRLAAECRARRARAATERTRRAAVRVTAPLGLCFLPAFLLAGVAPVVIGLARSLP